MNAIFRVDISQILRRYFALRSCRAPREISRSPHLAHKEPVMQASRAERCEADKAAALIEPK